MNSICIISRDRVYARMLFLELQSIPLEITTVTERVTTAVLNNLLEKNDLALLDADYYSGNIGILNQLKCNFIIISKNRTLNITPDIKNIIRVFERPFVTDDLIEFVKMYFSEKSINTFFETTEHVNFENITLNPKKKQAVIGNNIISLSPKEYQLLSLLYKNRGRLVSRKDVIEAIWGKDYNDKNNVDNVYINYLRKKLELPFGKKLIYTVRNKGYMMK